MKYFNKLLAFGLFPAIVLMVATTASAQQSCDPSRELCNPLNPSISSPRLFLATILRMVVIIALPFLSLAFVYVGFKFIAALGKPEDLKTAKKAFFYTVIGAIAILGAWQAALLLEATAKQVVGNN